YDSVESAKGAAYEHLTAYAAQTTVIPWESTYPGKQGEDWRNVYAQMTMDELENIVESWKQGSEQKNAAQMVHFFDDHPRYRKWLYDKFKEACHCEYITVYRGMSGNEWKEYTLRMRQEGASELELRAQKMADSWATNPTSASNFAGGGNNPAYIVAARVKIDDILVSSLYNPFWGTTFSNGEREVVVRADAAVRVKLREFWGSVKGAPDVLEVK